MGASPWDTAEYWVFGIIFGTILAKGLDLMFSDPPRYLGGSILTTLGLVGLLFTIPWTRTKVGGVGQLVEKHLSIIDAAS